MLFLVILVLLVYMNARLASKKGLNPIVWSIVSIVAFFIAYLFVGGPYFMAVYKGEVTRDAIEAWMLDHPLPVILMVMLGLGGVLVVRYILERKKTEE